MAYFTLPQKFVPFIEPGEQVLWVDRPQTGPFMLSALPLFLFGLAWGSFDFFVFILPMMNGTFHTRGGDGAPDGFLFPFFAFHLIPFWLGVGGMILAPWRATNLWYAVTNRRLLLSTGILGGGVKMIPYEKDFTMEVTTGLLGAGTLKIFSGEVSPKGQRLSDDMTAITNVQQVYRTIDETMHQFRESQGGPDALAQLAELKEKGLLSDDEWERIKAQFIGYPPDKRQEAMQELQALGDLHKKGVLTDSEFNMKKWDILSEK